MGITAVFDTNILISSLISTRGKPFRCLSLALGGVVESITCDEILQEYQEKLEFKFEFSPERAAEAVRDVRQCSRLVVIPNRLRVIESDPDDDKLLECARVGKATHIVTGDRRHLLPLSSYQGIQIVTADAFLAIVAQLGEGSSHQSS